MVRQKILDKEEKVEKPEKEIKEPTDEKVNSEKDYPYNVRICDIWGTTSKDTATIPVQRRIINSNVYLYNEKYGFKEPIPEDNDDFKDYKIDEVESQLKNLNKKLINKNSNENKKDIRQQIRRLKGIKSSIQLQGRGSYLRLGESGKPYFEFDRVGNFKMPVFKNIDKSLLKTPDEAKIKLGSELIRENEEKNGDPNKGIKMLNLVLTIILALLVCTFAFFTYTTAKVPKVCTEGFQQTANIINGAAEKFGESAETLNNISSRVYIKQPDIKINMTPNVVN
jgi:hypothetical protein